MTSLGPQPQLPAISVQNRPGPFFLDDSVQNHQRAVDGTIMPAARGYIDNGARAWPQPQPEQRMDPLVLTSYDIDEASWDSYAPFEANATKGQHDEFGFAPFEQHSYAQSQHPVIVYDDEDDLSEELEDYPLGSSTVANSPVSMSEFAANYQHQQQQDCSMNIDLVAPVAITTATTATTAVLGSEEYPSPICAPAPGDDGGCAHLNEYYYPVLPDHLLTNAIALPPVLPDQYYPPDSWSPFLAQDSTHDTGDIKETTRTALSSQETFLPAGSTETASMVAPPSVHLHAPRPMRIENTAAHLAALVEREESKLEAQERDEPLVDSLVVSSRTSSADQLSPLTAPALVMPYAQPHTQQTHPPSVPSHVQPSFVSQPALATATALTLTSAELPRRRIQPILELDTSGRTMQLRQSMRARRHARNLSVPMSADALQYRPVGWKGRQDVVGIHPHLLAQDQHASFGAWSAGSSRSVDWSALGDHLPFLQPPALAYVQPETYAPAALY